MLIEKHFSIHVSNQRKMAPEHEKDIRNKEALEESSTLKEAMA
jgi:hypothetical protein